MARRPFSKVKFASLPDRPRLPHGYDRCRAQDLDLDSEPFGKIRVHVRTLGSGPPLLLVHGFMTSSYSWRYVFEPLAEQFTVIAPDLPGAGRTPPRPDRSHSPRALATFVGEVQRAMNIDGCAAIGNSLGGYLCMQRVLQKPDAFSRLMVVHAPAFAELRNHALSTVLKLPGSTALLRKLVHRDPLRWVFSHVHYRDETLKSLEEAHEYGDPLSTRDGLLSFRRYLEDSVDPRELDRFENALKTRTSPWPTPLMLAYSREDPMVRPSVGPKLHALVPEAQFVWLENTSHFAHVDTPKQVVDLALKFFT